MVHCRCFVGVNIDNYSIVNTCDDYLWAWFDKKDSLYTQKDIIRYFFGNKEDFNLIKILTDEFSVYTPITVYSFFIKRVAPGESFDIVFTGINTPKETIDIKLDEVLKTLRIYKENDLSNIIKGIESLPRYQGRKAVFYEHNSIIFPLSVF